MTSDRLFRWLGRCLASDDDAGAAHAVRQAIERGEVDWHRFVRLASTHLVLPGVYLRFRALGLLDRLPPDLRDHLESIYALNLRRNRANLEQVGRLNRVWAAHHVVPIYLKGVANLLDGVYADVGERMSGDIDVLVSDEEFLRAADALQSSGYEAKYAYRDDDRQATKHYPRLSHAAEPADVEIHRVPVALELAEHFGYEAVAPHAVRIDGDDLGRVPCDSHKVVLNFLHGFMADPARYLTHVSYRSLFDLACLARRLDVFAALRQHPGFQRQARVYADFANHVLSFDRTRTIAWGSRPFLVRHTLGHRFPALDHGVAAATGVGRRLWASYRCHVVSMGCAEGSPASRHP